MVRINIKLEKRYRRKDGRSTLKITVYHDGKTLYAPTNVFIFADDWDEEKQVIKGAKNRALNTLLQKLKTDMEARLLSLQNRGLLHSYSGKRLMDYLQGKGDEERPHYFDEALKAYISNITNSRTKEIYRATEVKLQHFCDLSEITFEDMSVSWLRSFDSWLSRVSPSPNARSIHLRNIRTIFNAALDDNLISVYPFRRFKIPMQETEKRAISAEEIRNLYNISVPPFQRKYVDCFFLIFYLIGINIVDLSRLQAIDRGRVVYTRAKTHKLYSIKVEPEAKEILDKYKGKGHLLSWFDNVKDYRAFAQRLNKNLQEIAKKNNLPPITTYVARHSWASIASELDIPKDVISRALGHHLNVTDTYIRFNREKVDMANRAVIDYILRKEPTS